MAEMQEIKTGFPPKVEKIICIIKYFVLKVYRDKTKGIKRICVDDLI